MCKKILFSLLVMAGVGLFAGMGWALDEMEPNDARVAANTFNVGTSLRGGFPGGWGGDVVAPAYDYWQFNAQAGHSYRFRAVVENCSFISQIDIGMQLQDSSGTWIGPLADNAGYCGTETIEYNFSTGGTYYLVLFSNDFSALANYNVSTTDLGTLDTPTPTPTGTNTPLPTETRTPTPSPNVSGANDGWQDYR